MPTEGEPLGLRLKHGEEHRILGGHPWAFSNELQEVPRDAAPGSLAVLHASGGKPLGLGFFNPRSLISFRMLSLAPRRIDAEFFHGRLQEALRLRARLYPGEESFRLCFGESDGLPGLVVDKYGETLSLQVLSAGMESRLEEIREALNRLLSPKGILLRNDHPSRALEGLGGESRTLHGEIPAKVQIARDGLKYQVDLRGQKTGFYFDQCDNRAFLAPAFKGRTVLDLYCFTGAFSLSAARHGALRVLGLDSSESAVELARENARLNGHEACEFDAADAAQVLESFAGGEQKIVPDFILLDPPSFVPSKKNLPSALRAYLRLNASALRCLKPGGLLASSTCSHHVSRQDFLSMLRGAAAKAGRSCRVLAVRGQAQDHPMLLAMPETEYLHFALLEVL